jgi:hypothetical protein
MSRGKAVIVGIVLAWAVALFIAVRNYGEVGKLTAENTFLRSHMQELEDEAVRLSNSVAQAAVTGGNDRSPELLRLRAEVTALRKQTNELERLRGEVTRLRSAVPAPRGTADANEPEPPKSEERLQAEARLGDSRTYVLGFILHANDNGGRVATNFDQIAAYIAGNNKTTGTNRFEIVYSGPLQAVTNPSATILLREAEARQQTNGRWSKTYAFVDGHSEIHMEPENNFEEFERQRIIPPSP